MLLNELQDYTQFHPAKAPGTFKRYGFKPDFRDHLLASHMDVWGKRYQVPFSGKKPKM
jgi:hypothetical protein